jgi:hypothetical protein
VFLRSKPSPISEDPIPYTPARVTQLVERLQPWDLSKGELLMILNLRPSSVLELNSIVEDPNERFSYDQQRALVKAIAEVLAPIDEDQQNGAGGINGGAGGDATMKDAAS